MRPLENILLLRNILRANGWYTTAFPYIRNGIVYTVIFEDSKALELADDFTIAVLTFIHIIDDEHIVELEVRANTQGFSIDNKEEFFNFFGIEFAPHTHDFWTDFYTHLNPFIPVAIPVLDDEQKKRVARKTAEREHADNPDAFYCYDVRHLGKYVDSQGVKQQKTRSIFMDNKTRLLRPRLYHLVHAENDNTITFYYSPNEDDEKTDAEILRVYRSRRVSE